MEKYIIEPEKILEVTKSTDVLVAGGGIAGIAAAIAAARNGKKVILLEREYFLGGMATLGLITIYLPLCDGEGNQMVFGIGEELLKLSIKHGAEANYPEAWLNNGNKEDKIKHRYVTQFNPYLFGLSIEELLRSLDVEIIFGTMVSGVSKNTSGDKIESAIIENKSGRHAIEAKVFIDCTGDADICCYAGVETELHSNGNGLASWYYYYSKGKVSLKMFGLADITPEQQEKLRSKQDDSDYDAVKVESLDNNIRFSGVDGYELSEAVLIAHAKMYDDILQNSLTTNDYVPTTVSSIPLVRMSRHIVGEKTMDESYNHSFAEDSIGTVGDWRKRGPAYEIPFGSLYNKEVKNLIVAGRDTSVSEEVWEVMRVIPACAVTGEAAGTAASMCEDFSSIDIEKLQNRLIEQKVKLHVE